MTIRMSGVLRVESVKRGVGKQSQKAWASAQLRDLDTREMFQLSFPGAVIPDDFVPDAKISDLMVKIETSEKYGNTFINFIGFANVAKPEKKT